MPSRFAIFLSCCIALLQPVPAAGARWRHFDVDDGLPQNSAVAMTVDRHGLLWVGTEDGLARFDGERFVAFDRAVERAWLPGNYIVALASDAHSVWIAAESGGLSRFDLDSERFERIAAKDPDTGAELNIWSITVDRNVLWIGTRDRGLLALDRHEPTRVVAHWHADAPAGHRLALRAVRHVAVDHRGDGVWVAGTGGLAHIANGHGDARNEELAGIDMGQSEPDVASIVSRGDGSLWLGLRSQGVVRRRAGERQFERIALSAADQPEMLVVNQLAEAAPGVLMAATDRGLYVLDRSCDCFHPAPSSSPLRQSLEQSLMLSVVATTDVVWAGSWNRGLFRFDPRAPGFDLLTPADLAGRGEPTPPRALYVDRRQRLWVGSFGAGVHFASISERPMARWAWQQWRGSEDTRDHQVWAFAESRSGDLFIGSDAGLTRWRNEGRELAFLDLEPTEMDEVRNLLSASDGALWASTVGGVYRIDPDTLAVRRFGGEHGLRDVRAYALAEWPRGRIVIGTWAGLFALDMDDGRVVPIDLRLDGRAYEPRLVWDLAPDGGDGLWIGTSNGLLHLANANDPALRRFDTSDGLPNNVVYAIEGHGEDELWLSTNRGLARFDRARARSVAFDVRDGLQGNEFGFGMAARDAAGHLYFAGLGGVNRFDPAQVHVTPQAPRTLLNHFRLRDRDLVVGAAVDGAIPLPRSLYATDRIELGWRQRDIGFGFSALANDPTEHLLFRYRLVGKDDEWIDAGERRYVGYTNLAPGAYRFEVRAADRFGRDGPVRAVDIDLAPPFWTTWPFLVAASAALLSLFAAILNWRVAALKRSRAMLAAEVARQTERIRLQNEQLEAANHALFERSIRDPLTGAFNRRHFGELAEHAYLGCRARVQPFALLLFDLDHFKQVNDRHGHAAGDAVLCAVAQAVRATLSGQEAMARWGGEEFVAMWPGIDADMAASRATAVRDALRTLRIASDGTTLGITASFGLAVATSTWQPTLEALIAHADAALYRAKADGRDRVVVAAPPT